MGSLETDDFHGSCGEGVDPLLTSIRKELNGGDPDPPTPGTTTTTTLDPTASTTPTTATTKATTVVPDQICKHEGINDDPDPADCAHFYDCHLVDGTWQVKKFECGKGSVFNPKINSCDFPYNVPGCEDYPPYEENHYRNYRI